MLVSDVFTKLALLELSNTTIGGDGSGVIQSGKENQLIAAINDGLMNLYTRFALNQKDIIVQPITGIYDYPMDSKYAYSKHTAEGAPDYYYIMDYSTPFQDDVIKILDVYAMEHGRRGLGKLPLNDSNEPFSLFTPIPTTLQIPHPDRFETISVNYQAMHPTLVATTDQVYLPNVFDKALRSYVAYVTFSAINSTDAAAKAQEQYALFESICQDITANDLAGVSVSETNVKFHERGWI